MKLIRTIKIKLDINNEDIIPTLQAYTNAFNYVCQVGFKEKNYNKISLQQLTYKYLRSNFKLPSQLAISSCHKAAEAIKSVYRQKNKYKTCPKSEICAIRLDKNSYSLFLSTKEISILTISGRKRYGLLIPDYYKNYFNSWKYKSADLFIKQNKVYIHISFEKDIEDKKCNGKMLGIDRGINNIAVSSDNKFYSGKQLKKLCNKYKTIRKQLQKCGTKSAKRHLKRLAGKERRFKADINHQISKKIVDSLNPGDIIVLENLTGIRNKRLRKPQRTLINSWNFYQLGQFLTYKALAKNIEIKYIDARYTSQRCSKCGFICRSNRKTQSGFCCKQCGFKLNADLNASRNICMKASGSYMQPDEAAVNQPIVSTEMLDTSSCL